MEQMELDNVTECSGAKCGAVPSFEQNLRRFQKLMTSTSEIVEVMDYDNVMQSANAVGKNHFEKMPNQLRRVRDSSFPA